MRYIGYFMPVAYKKQSTSRSDGLFFVENYGRTLLMSFASSCELSKGSGVAVGIGVGAWVGASVGMGVGCSVAEGANRLGELLSVTGLFVATGPKFALASLKSS
ncbi:MAG: hypothetical protein E7335_04890 [Clostridiales bacterium]|nr:hypothetical protein [Clostridiales bacterium]